MTPHNGRILQLGAGKTEMLPCSALFWSACLHFAFAYSSVPVRLLMKSLHRTFVLQYSAAVSKGNVSDVFVLLPLRLCSSTFVGWLGYCPIEGSEQEMFLFSTSSRQILGRNRPPIQWVMSTLSPEVKRPQRDANHSPSSTAEVKNAWRYTFSPHMSSQRSAFLSKETSLPLVCLSSEITGR
jgi:hypothetical protein